MLTPSILAISPYVYPVARSCLALSRTSTAFAGSARRITPALVSGPSDDPEAVPGLASANARLSASDQRAPLETMAQFFRYSRTAGRDAARLLIAIWLRTDAGSLRRARMLTSLQTEVVDRQPQPGHLAHVRCPAPGATAEAAAVRVRGGDGGESNAPVNTGTLASSRQRSSKKLGRSSAGSIPAWDRLVGSRFRRLLGSHRIRRSRPIRAS